MHLNRKDSIFFLAPSTALYAVFVIFPVFLGLVYAFTDISGFSTQLNFVGLANFQRIFQDARFLNSLRITLFFTLLYSVFSNTLGLILALLLELNLRKTLKNTIRVLFYIPAVLTPTVVGFIWYYMYKIGLPALFKLFGLTSLAKLQYFTTDTALFSVINVTTWMNAGVTMIIFIAGLSNISTDLYEAAEIDGASKIRTFLHISIPLIIPSFLINTVLSIISGAKQFDQIFTMTKGGPGNSTELITVLIMNKGFSANDMAYACAAAFVLFICVMIIASTIIRLFGQKEVEN